jgi:predicted membrane protein
VAVIAVILIIKHIFGIEDSWDKHPKWKNCGSNVQEYREGYLKSHVVCSSNEKIYLNENFTGGKIETIFGSQEIDLRKCVIPSGTTAELEIKVVCGSCEIWVPTEWKVQFNAKSIGSTLEDKRTNILSTAEETLIIIGECVFSKLEIRS